MNYSEILRPSQCPFLDTRLWRCKADAHTASDAKKVGQCVPTLDSNVFSENCPVVNGGMCIRAQGPLSAAQDTP